MPKVSEYKRDAKCLQHAQAFRREEAAAEQQKGAHEPENMAARVSAGGARVTTCRDHEPQTAKSQWDDSRTCLL